MQLATYEQVADSLRHLDHYRVVRAQELAEEAAIPGIDGALVIALGLRETWGRNIEGGAMKNPTSPPEWIAEIDPTKMDVGWLQISRRFHAESLSKMVAVKTKTWSPVVEGKTANDAGFVPRFSDALRFTLKEMRIAVNYARDRSVKSTDQARFAVAAHNCGKSGAFKGYQESNLDKYTAGGDYSAWVLDAAKKVHIWLMHHENWIYHP